MSGTVGTGTVFEVPLIAAPQTLTISLNGVRYGLALSYRDAANGGWTVDVLDANGNDLACGIPLVTGVDLLAPYAYLGIGGSLYVASDGDPLAVPTFANLGQSPGGHLYFVPSS